MSRRLWHEQKYIIIEEAGDMILVCDIIKADTTQNHQHLKGALSCCNCTTSTIKTFNYGICIYDNINHFTLQKWNDKLLNMLYNKE